MGVEGGVALLDDADQQHGQEQHGGGDGQAAIPFEARFLGVTTLQTGSQAVQTSLGGRAGDLPIAAGLGQLGNLQGIPAFGTLDDESGTALVDFEVVAAFRTIKVDQRHACLLFCAGETLQLQ